MAGKRGNQTVRGMIQSMAVICAFAGVIYLFIPHDDSLDPIRPVDYRVELVTARRAAPYPVAAPAGLPADWKPTSVTFRREEGHAWHLGFLDPDGQYVAVEQSTEAPRKYVPRVTRQAAPTDTTQRVGEETWQRWEGPKYDALVRTDQGSTTVVTGTASYERLAQMAAALESESGATPSPVPSAS
ncbi:MULTISPECIES: DUF4245 domain-containing protein [unclassified Streptomyces]|uniref:DUF4245 domain-containing protein n=1 Tax=unclassified Streptomyces TaxID=2593676 RepID=UPI000F4542C5|nr:DUF4245 domain-containing protein [Streptomyces sp. I6]RNL72576.1 DUF4245 domain-containing protein [Streptomyces sp. I6]